MTSSPSRTRFEGPPAPIAVALDAPDLAAVALWTAELVGVVSTVKVGLEVFCRDGAAAVTTARAAAAGMGVDQIDVFLDLKLHDIPATVRGAALAVAPLAAVVEHKTSWRFHYDRLRATAGSGVFDVICHTPAGLVTECTTGNLALELDGRWVTPASGCGLLPGVERAARIEAAATITGSRHNNWGNRENGRHPWSKHGSRSMPIVSSPPATRP